MKFLSGILLIVLCIVVHGEVHANPNNTDRMPYFNEVLKLEMEQIKKYDLTPFFGRILNPKSVDEVTYAMDYLKMRIVGTHTVQGVDYKSALPKVSTPFYYTVYAMLLWKMHEGATAFKMRHTDEAFAREYKQRFGEAAFEESKQYDGEFSGTAIATANAAMLILFTDKARCADRSAGENQIHATAQRLKKPLKAFAELSDEEQKESVSLSLLMEESIVSRSVNRPLCRTGTKALRKTLEWTAKNNIEPTTAPNPSGIGTITTYPNSPNVKVDSIGDSKWHELRKMMRSRYHDYLLDKVMLLPIGMR